MTDDATLWPRRKAAVLTLGAAAVLATLGAVYVIGTGDGNGSAAACAAAETAGKALKPLAKGEVAGFLPAQTPLSVADLAFSDDAGAQRSIADFAGKTVLLNLWATWCAPCREEMPALDSLQAELGSEHFQVVAVSVDRGTSDRPKAFLEEVGATNLPFYADPRMAIFHTLGGRGRATGLPTTVLIHGEGCALGAMYGAADWAAPDAKALISAATASSATN